MKLAMIGPYPVNSESDRISGGVQAVVVNLAKGLSRFSDLDIHIVTARHSIKKNIEYKSNGITVHAVPLDRIFGNTTLYSNTRKKIIKKIYEIKPDIIHSHCFGYETLAALDSGHKKIIISTHGITTAKWGSRYNILDTMRVYMQNCIYRRCIKRAENILINIQYARQHLAGFKKMKISELNNPISDIFLDIDNNLEEGQRILFVGNVCQRKGIMTILEAINILKPSFENLRLMIAGPIAEPDYYSKLSRFIKEQGLSKYVNFLFQLNEDELKKEYQKASIFAFPSLKDEAPVALLQAMASGKAIVATRAGGIPYMIDEGVTGFLIEKEDSMALADRISLFIKDDELRKKFGANAREKVIRENSITAVTDKLYEIYNRVNNNGIL